MVAEVAFLALVFVGSLGCGASPLAPHATTGTCSSLAEDLDGDGHCLDYDCDESDPQRYVFAEEVAGDGVDHNCDGTDG